MNPPESLQKYLPGVEPFELYRLGIQLAEIRRYAERRVEHADIASARHYSWTIRYQIRIPILADEPAPNELRKVLVPLGLFEKTRLPDLVVTDGTQRRLPVLTRGQRQFVLSSLFMARYFEGSVRPADGDAEFQRFARLFTRRVARIIGGNYEEGTREVARLRKFMGDVLSREPAYVPQRAIEAIRVLSDLDDFWTDLLLLVGTTHLLAVTSAMPGDVLHLDIQFRDDLDLHDIAIPIDYRDGELGPVVPTSRLLRWIRRRAKSTNRINHRFGLIMDQTLLAILKGLLWLGVVPWSAERRNVNADHCESFYLSLSLGPGVETVRLYWRKAENTEYIPAAIPIMSDSATLSVHRGKADVEPERLVGKSTAGRPELTVHERPATRHTHPKMHNAMDAVNEAVPLRRWRSERWTKTLAWLRIEPAKLRGGAGTFESVGWTSVAEFQMSTSGGVARSIALSLFIVAMETIVALHVPTRAEVANRSLFVATLQLFVAVPAALIASVASEEGEMRTYLSRGPRALAFVTASFAALVAMTIGFLSTATLAFVMAVTGGSLGLFTAGVFAYIGFGRRYSSPNVPRCRDGWKSAVMTASQRRYRQRRAASFIVTAILALSVVYFVAVFVIGFPRLG